MSGTRGNSFSERRGLTNPASSLFVASSCPESLFPMGVSWVRFVWLFLSVRVPSMHVISSMTMNDRVDVAGKNEAVFNAEVLCIIIQQQRNWIQNHHSQQSSNTQVYASQLHYAPYLLYTDFKQLIRSYASHSTTLQNCHKRRLTQHNTQQYVATLLNRLCSITCLLNADCTTARRPTELNWTDQNKSELGLEASCTRFYTRRKWVEFTGHS